MRILVGLGLVAACGGGGGGDLTCELLADPGNCWAEAAAELAACLPARATPATLAADRASCTFTDGTRVVFETPLPSDTIQLERLAFVVESAGGGECGRFVDTFMNRMELTAGGATAVSELDGGSLTLACEDGASFSTAFENVFECATVAPTDGFEVTPTTFAFTVVSVATPGNLFTCVQ